MNELYTKRVGLYLQFIIIISGLQINNMTLQPSFTLELVVKDENLLCECPCREQIDLVPKRQCSYFLMLV